MPPTDPPRDDEPAADTGPATEPRPTPWYLSDLAILLAFVLGLTLIVLAVWAAAPGHGCGPVHQALGHC